MGEVGHVGCGLPGEHPPTSSWVSAPTPSILQREIVAQEGVAGEDSGGSLLDNKRPFILSPLIHSQGLGPEHLFSPSPENHLAPLHRAADQIKVSHIDGLSFGSHSDSPTSCPLVLTPFSRFHLWPLPDTTGLSRPKLPKLKAGAT